MIYVVDASVAVKWVIGEEGSDRAAQLFENPVMAPDLLIVEAVNVLWKKVRRKELSPEEAAAAAMTLRLSGIAYESMVPLADEVLGLSLRLSHPAYDCAYLALARSVGGVLVTADEKFVARCLQPDAKNLAPHIVSLFQWRAPGIGKR